MRLRKASSHATWLRSWAEREICMSSSRASAALLAPGGPSETRSSARSKVPEQHSTCPTLMRPASWSPAASSNRLSAPFKMFWARTMAKFLAQALAKSLACSTRLHSLRLLCLFSQPASQVPQLMPLALKASKGHLKSTSWSKLNSATAAITCQFCTKRIEFPLLVSLPGGRSHYRLPWSPVAARCTARPAPVGHPSRCSACNRRCGCASAPRGSWPL